MARSVGVSVSGMDDVLAKLGLVGERAKLGAIDGINHTAIDVQRDAKKGAAVDTGRMRSSIGLDPATSARPEARVEASVHYAEHVEFGTQHQTAQPFMGPAVELNLPKHARNVAAGVKRRMGA